MSGLRAARPPGRLGGPVHTVRGTAGSGSRRSPPREASLHAQAHQARRAASARTLALATPALTVAATAAQWSQQPHHPRAVVGRQEEGARSSSSGRPRVSSPASARRRSPRSSTAAARSSSRSRALASRRTRTSRSRAARPSSRSSRSAPGTYKVTGSYEGRKAKTKFEVYNSALTVELHDVHLLGLRPTLARTPRCSAASCSRTSRRSAATSTSTRTGSSRAARVAQLPRLHQHPRRAARSTRLLGFGAQITKGCGLAGGNLPAFGPGTYQFQAYYTDGPEYSDYISSNFITVVVTP